MTNLLTWDLNPAAPAMASHSHFFQTGASRGRRAGPRVAGGLAHMGALGEGLVAGLVAAQQLGPLCLAGLQRRNKPYLLFFASGGAAGLISNPPEDI